jgi:hypothetical protein
MEPKPSNKFFLDDKVEALRSDQRGSLTLLAGMIVFLATIFTMIAFDTNKAIYDRIVAQNAVDAAADSAALWQARACNLLQELNNIHYTADEVAAYAEVASGIACVLADGFMVTQAALLDSVLLAEFAPAAMAARYASCVVCDQLPGVDVYQNMMYNAVMDIQYGIICVTPYLAFGYANACAEGSGADSILAVASSGLATFCSMVGISNPPDLSTITGALGNIPIYAVPLDPDAVGILDPPTTGLYVTPKVNSGFPESWPDAVGQAGEVAGDIGCSSESGEDPDAPMPPGPLIYPPPFFGYFDDADEAHSSYNKTDPMQVSGTTQTWGWNDDYYFGWPGYMTWVAGVTNHPELLNLGNLAWLNGGNNVPSSFYTQNNPVLDQASMPAYTGGAQPSGGSTLTIPTYIAIASSQVEGSTVVCQGDANAVPVLMRVYFPFPPQSTNSPGTELPFPITIYH